MPLKRQSKLCAVATALFALGSAFALAANQTATLSPIELNSRLPYRIELRPYSMGIAEVPTLHSYAVGQFEGKWLFLAGRTNGLHGFNGSTPDANFPAASQNRDVWVIDLANGQTWSRPLDDPTSALTEAQIASLSPTNNQFYQSGNSLYVAGGYGVNENSEFVTFSTLSAIDVAGLGDWVIDGAGSAAEHIRQIHDPLFQVTGGAMFEHGGRTRLVFGQNFEGAYRPNLNGVYTNQVRSFDIIDDGTNLSVQNVASTAPDSNYRRRDLNVFPIMRPVGSTIEPGLLALSGVFTPTNGVWTVPVEFDANGVPSMLDPGDPISFKQGFNNYHSAKLGLFSQATGEMHEILFGGISLQYREPTNDSIATDNQLPFVNDVSAVVIDAAGTYSQHHLGWFPEIVDLAGNRLRFGANAEFLLAEGIETYDNGVIKLDQFAGRTVVGHIFGGLVANAPHTRGSPSTLSAASNQVFEVVLIAVPEPGGYLLAWPVFMVLAAGRGRRKPAG